MIRTSRADAREAGPAGSGVFLLRAALAIPVALGLSWLVAGDALDEMALLSRRSLPGASSPALDARDAERRLSRGDTLGAERSAVAALARAPLEVSAIRTLGLARIAAGEPAGGRALMLLAGRLGWRDQQTQLWLLAAAAEQGDFVVAMQRADALLRQDLVTARVLPILRAAIRVPAAADALAAELATGPGWRHTFFGDLAGLPEDGFADHLAMYDRVAAKGAPPTRSELLPFVNLLIQRERVPAAYALWRRYGRGAAAGPAAYVEDGGFSAPAIDDPAAPRFPFEWAFDDAGGGASGIQQGPSGDGGQALRAEASGAGTSRIIRQTLALPPGRYVLGYRALAESPQALDSYRWSIACNGADVIAALPARTAADASGWISLAASFSIPADGCLAQQLELATRNIGSGQLVAWFDDVRIERR